MGTASLIAAGWASGINAYATVLILGLAGRFGWADTPAALHRPWVLIVAAVMFLIEFVVDKIPYVDNIWDAIHTFVRPAIAAAIGTASATHTAAALGGVAATSLGKPQASVLAAALALTGHGAKATTRLVINLSPEPFSNIITSLTEDGIVAGLVTLAMVHPYLAGSIGLGAAVLSVIVTVMLFKVARRGWRKVRAWFGDGAPARLTA